MNIAFDIDGVLWDIEEFQLKYGEKYFAKRGLKIINPNGFGIKDTFGCSDHQEKTFWAAYMLRGLFARAREQAEDVVKEFKKRGHHICIITSRAETTETSFLGALMRFLVRTWLKMNAIHYDEIVFCDDHDQERSKMKACRKLAVDVIVEDRIENIDTLKHLTRVIGFRTRNNQFYEDASLPFVHSFQEVAQQLEKLEKMVQG